MVKKSNVKIPTIVIIRLIVFLFIGLIFFWIYSNTADFLSNAPMFNVKDVKVDQSISFIDPKYLTGLKGQNIFNIDLNKIHQRISKEYPQISQLRVTRRLPDTVVVLAKARDILLQLHVQNRFLIVDTEGVTMYYSSTPVPYPMINGVTFQKNSVVLGATSKIKELNVAIELLKQLKSHPHTSRLKINTIEAANLSKIEFMVLPNIKIIVDQDDLPSKIAMLELLFQNGKINWNNVKYIDVRFKEPIINETIPQEEK